MKPNGIEKKILEKMSENLVVRKAELIEHLKKSEKASKSTVEASIGSLVSKGFLSPIYACETTFAITQKGIREFEILK